MSVIVKNMEMPKTCADCHDADLPTAIAWLGAKCPWAHGIIDPGVYDLRHERHPDCPLVELPPHGDLIDRDALLAEYERDERAADEHGREFSFSFDSGGARCAEWWIVQQKLMDAPVIVSADKEETE